MRHSRHSEWSKFTVCSFMTSCHLSIFSNLVIFLVFTLTARLFECFFFSAWFFASSNITSHLFYPSADQGRLVFRVLQTVLSVGGETPAGTVDGIQGELSSRPANIFCKKRKRAKCTQSWSLYLHIHTQKRRKNPNTPIKSHTPHCRKKKKFFGNMNWLTSSG